MVGVGGLGDLVDERAHDLGGLGLRYGGEEGPQVGEQRAQLGRLALLRVHLAQLVDRALLWCHSAWYTVRHSTSEADTRTAYVQCVGPRG
eukprot:scaffold93294_cov53-Phaeocystis_antarctica.AAC.2